jgi:hypothetical protein
MNYDATRCRDIWELIHLYDDELKKLVDRHVPLKLFITERLHDQIMQIRLQDYMAGNTNLTEKYKKEFRAIPYEIAKPQVIEI